jgi:hypothetical protein
MMMMRKITFNERKYAFVAEKKSKTEQITVHDD